MIMKTLMNILLCLNALKTFSTLKYVVLHLYVVLLKKSFFKNYKE